ncbi:ABC transporter permease [Cytobacillus sp. IB215665]|uniref:ABC transporter permease n=1 Tax=Cytobacillus sp. IB215665 TaxID=3097357 RepID=UPI002A130C80|nr:ABC transporter permease subunit [Cytobacillus sp. IB215665]MDX8365634.1 ABC transporter permease subunit [Cytobacillus sp. IB215665]
MKQLLKFELYKIFRQKGIYIVMVLMFLLFSLVMVSESRNVSPKADTYTTEVKEELNTFAQEWEGNLTSEKVEEATQTLDSLPYANTPTSSLTNEELAKYNIVQQILFNDNTTRDIKSKITELEIKLDKLSENDISYKTALLKINMLNHLKLDTFQYNQGPINTIDFVERFAPYFTGILMLIGLASIFVNETNTGMDQLIYSSTYGRQKGVTAKIIASLVYVLFLTTVWVMFNIVMNSYIYGNIGWNSPIQFLRYPESPYTLTAIEYFFSQIGIHLLVAFAFMTFVLTVSAITKSTLVSFIISAVTFLLPTINLGVPYWEYVKQYSFSNFMTAPEFTKPFHALNLFGVPVLDPIVNYPLVALFTVMFMMMLYKAIKNKQVA